MVNFELIFHVIEVGETDFRPVDYKDSLTHAQPRCAHHTGNKSILSYMTLLYPRYTWAVIKYYFIFVSVSRGRHQLVPSSGYYLWQQCDYQKQLNLILTLSFIMMDYSAAFNSNYAGLIIMIDFISLPSLNFSTQLYVSTFGFNVITIPRQIVRYKDFAKIRRDVVVVRLLSNMHYTPLLQLYSIIRIPFYWFSK